MKKVFISDYTLDAAGKNTNNSLLFREKMAFASLLDDLGADYIELGEIKNSKEDEIIFKTISSKIKKCGVCVKTKIKTEEIDKAYECIKSAKKPCIQICLPVSTVRLEYLFHIKSDKLLDKIRELCSYTAKKECEVEFIAEDASRADVEFLSSCCKAACESGADRVTICDDAGIYMPEDIAKAVKGVINEVDKPVFVKVSDFASLAVANAIAAVNAGAQGVKGLISHSDGLKIKNFALLLRKKGDDLGLYCGLDDTKIYSDIKEILNKTSHISSNDSEGGEDLLITCATNLDELKKATMFLGYSLSAEDLGKVYSAVQNVCQKKNCIGSKELEAIIAANAQQAPSTYHLESYLTTSGSITSSISQLSLRFNDTIITGVAQGDGPIDSAFKAIEQAIGCHYELDDFQIQSVTEGKEALGAALVRLRSNGKLYSGNGLSTDIVAASLRAYINALNKIVYDN